MARKQAGLRVRQPLARMLVAVGGTEERSANLLRYRVKPNLRLLGPRLGKRLLALRAALDGMTVTMGVVRR